MAVVNGCLVLTELLADVEVERLAGLKEALSYYLSLLLLLRSLSRHGAELAAMLPLHPLYRLLEVSAGHQCAYVLHLDRRMMHAALWLLNLLNNKIQPFNFCISLLQLKSCNILHFFKLLLEPEYLIL